MPKSDTQIATEITGIKSLSVADDKIDATELSTVLNSLNDNKLNLQDYTPSGSGTAHPAIAYVTTNGNNSTGTVGDYGSPFLTIEAALSALPSTGGVIYLGVGSFAAPSDSAWKNDVTVIGRQIPRYNWTVTQNTGTSVTYTAPTALTGGSIIKGGMVILDKANIAFMNLGIDVGSAYVSGGGTVKDGLIVALSTTGTAATPPLNILSNFYAKNLVILGQAFNSSYHCLLFENIHNAVIDNVQTCYHVHGIVSKSTNSSISNVKCYSHENDAIILKSNNYSVNSRNTLSNFVISSVSGNQGAGLFIQNASSYSTGVMVVTNGIVYKTSYGVLTNGNVPYLNMTNVLCQDITANGFKLENISDGKVSDCTAISCGDDGFEVDATRVILSDNVSLNNTGYGYRYTSGAYGGQNFANGNGTGASTGTITAV